MATCVVCDSIFEQKLKGFKRISVLSITTPRTFGKVFQKSPQKFFIPGNFICTACLSKLKMVAKHTTKSGKRRWQDRKTPIKHTESAPGSSSSTPAQPSKRQASFSTPKLTEPPLPSFHSPSPVLPSSASESNSEAQLNKTYIQKATEYFESFRYLAGFAILAHNSKAAKKALIETACTIIKKEFRMVQQEQGLILTEKLSRETLARFSWSSAINELAPIMPATVACFNATLPVARQIRRQTSRGRKGCKRNLRPHEVKAEQDRSLGHMLAVALHKKSPKKFNFVQQSVGVELWRQGAPHKVFRTLCHMGISQGVGGARNNVDRLGAEHDQQLLLWKQNLEVSIEVVDANPSTTSGMVAVLEHLQQYVAVKEGKPVENLVGGDGLSIERIIHTQHARNNGENWHHRLDSMWAAPQEFHKEILLLQDSNNRFFVGASIADRGTISQLKSDFNHRALRKDVMSNFQHVWDMYEFTTDGYVLLCAMQLQETTMKSFPSQGTSEDQLDWLHPT
ncbi:PREDICTED: uncharacterized protein LOC106809356 [Priapulus caudatus]|uniref:Uncharacterized protein LOC106809356 n=1 Tax=Priapulus caudatus TaxID=37621 RepID=A0ABM1E6T5_PRICU|nr:PREDICTED: uncharacterized protein LOC106809356 [Priapulus caudatus]